MLSNHTVLKNFEDTSADIRLLVSFSVRNWSAIKLQMPSRWDDRGRRVPRVSLCLWNGRNPGQSMDLVHKGPIHGCMTVVEKDLKSDPNIRLTLRLQHHHYIHIQIFFKFLFIMCLYTIYMHSPIYSPMQSHIQKIPLSHCGHNKF